MNVLQYYLCFLAFCYANVLPTASWDSSSEQDDYGTEDYDESNLSSAEETVGEFLNKFQTLAASTADVGAFMERISLEAFTFLKLAIPVGSLAAGSLRISTKPESKEYQALMLLRDTMEIRFKELDRTIGTAAKVISLDMGLLDYSNHVHVPSKGLAQKVDYFCDPKVEKSAEDVQRLKKWCYDSASISENTPLAILNYIHTHTVDYCNGGLTARQIGLLGEFIPLLSKVKDQINSEIHKNLFDQKSSELSIWFTELELNDARKVLKKMEALIDASSNYNSAHQAFQNIKAFFLETGTEPQQNWKCLLQDIITAKLYHRKVIEEMENVIRIDVLKLMLFGGICANITFGGSKSSMDWYQNRIKTRVTEIIGHVQSYISSELEKSFPKIEVGVVVSVLNNMFKPGMLIDNATVALAKNEIFSSLDLIGNKKYARQGFITTNLQNDTNIISRCIPENCFVVFNHNCLHVMVTRYNMDMDEDRAVDSFFWLNKNRPFIRKFVEENYNIDRVTTLLNTFEEKYFKLTQPELYHHIAILRNFGPTSKCGLIASSNIYPLEDYSASGAVSYYFEGSLWHSCESFIIHFFV